MHLLAGVAQTGSPLPVNNALLVTPDGDVRRYSKIHPFSLAGEEKVFAGGTGVPTWEVAGARVTPQVCYDLRFPEPFRLAADGTDVYVVIANWPERRRAHWQTLLRARAIENLAYVLGVNRVGEGGDLHYAGDSAAISPWGETLASAAEIETVLLVDVDPRQVADARSRFTALKDRRPGSYSRPSGG
jgi:predicted amidohydrolase